MEVKLEKIIEKLRKEGVEEAKAASEAMIEKAKKEAAEIVEQAKKEADELREKGKSEADHFQKNAERAIQQAGRDARLLLKEQILDMLDRVLKKEVSEKLDPEFMSRIILEVVKGWKKGEGVELVVSGSDKMKLEALVLKRLKEEVREPVTLTVSPEISGGFRIGIKDQDVYYDFTDESIAEMLGLFLNPSLNELMERSNG